MRMTIDVPDGLGQQAMHRASQRGCTFTALVVEGLHRVLAETPPESVPLLPTWGDGTGKVLVDLSDRDAVYEVLNSDGLR